MELKSCHQSLSVFKSERREQVQKYFQSQVVFLMFQSLLQKPVQDCFFFFLSFCVSFSIPQMPTLAGFPTITAWSCRDCDLCFPWIEKHTCSPSRFSFLIYRNANRAPQLFNKPLFEDLSRGKKETSGLKVDKKHYGFLFVFRATLMSFCIEADAKLDAGMSGLCHCLQIRLYKGWQPFMSPMIKLNFR